MSESMPELAGRRGEGRMRWRKTGEVNYEMVVENGGGK
jgi:hypothetical protein